MLPLRRLHDFPFRPSGRLTRTLSGKGGRVSDDCTVSLVAQHRMTGEGRKALNVVGIQRCDVATEPAGWRDSTVDFGKFMSLFILGKAFCDAVARHMDAERYHQWGVEEIPG